MGCRITKGVTERCTARLRLTIQEYFSGCFCLLSRLVSVVSLMPDFYRQTVISLCSHIEENNEAHPLIFCSQIHISWKCMLVHYCYIVGLGLNRKFIDLLFKRSFIKFIEISLYLDFIVSEIICKQTDTLNQGLIHQRQF